EGIRIALREALDGRMASVVARLDEELKDYYGCQDLAELVRWGTGGSVLSVRLNATKRSAPLLTTTVSSSEVSQTHDLPPLSGLTVPVGRALLTALRGEVRPEREGMSRELALDAFADLQWQLWIQLLRQRG